MKTCQKLQRQESASRAWLLLPRDACEVFLTKFIWAALLTQNTKKNVSAILYLIGERERERERERGGGEGAHMMNM